MEDLKSAANRAMGTLQRIAHSLNQNPVPVEDIHALHQMAHHEHQALKAALAEADAPPPAADGERAQSEQPPKEHRTETMREAPKEHRDSLSSHGKK